MRSPVDLPHTLSHNSILHDHPGLPPLSPKNRDGLLWLFTNKNENVV